MTLTHDQAETNDEGQTRRKPFEVTPFRWLLNWLEGDEAEHAHKRNLEKLSDRCLRDMDASRADLAAEIRRTSWSSGRGK